MKYKNKSLIFSLFFILTIQILLLINNNQKSSFKYFVWKIQEVSIGKLICISFMSGFIISYIISKRITDDNKIYDKKEKDIDNKNDYFTNSEDSNNSFEIPPQRDLREPQPTISVNYRVIKNKGGDELEDRSNASNDIRHEDDDWISNNSEW